MDRRLLNVRGIVRGPSVSRLRSTGPDGHGPNYVQGNSIDHNHSGTPMYGLRIGRCIRNSHYFEYKTINRRTVDTDR